MSSSVSSIMDSEAAAYAAQVLGSQKGVSFSPFLLGMVLDAMLLGVVLNQLVHWFEHSWATDGWVVRALVIWVGIMAPAISIYTLVWQMDLFVYGFADYLNFLNVSWFSWTFIFWPAIRTPVSLFFTERAYRMLGRSKLLIAVLTPL
ncbi:hypothetical protein Q5752_005863 [Cryptotrichosporon argae]